MIELLRRLVFHNFLLKMLSLLLAAGLWWLISPDEEPAEVSLRAPVVLQHVPPGLEISSESVPEAQIRLRDRSYRRQAGRAHFRSQLQTGAPLPRGRYRASCAQSTSSCLRHDLNPRRGNSPPSHGQLRGRRADHQSRRRSTPGDHLRSSAPRRENYRCHHRSARRHRHSRSWRLFDQRLRLRSHGAGRATLVDPRHGNGAESWSWYHALTASASDPMSFIILCSIFL
jgi:hypothetical protein